MSRMGRQIAESLVIPGQVSGGVDRCSLPAHEIDGRTRIFAWDPHEIWLERIKQPRDNAARVAGKIAA